MGSPWGSGLCAATAESGLFSTFPWMETKGGFEPAVGTAWAGAGRLSAERTTQESLLGAVILRPNIIPGTG